MKKACLSVCVFLLSVVSIFGQDFNLAVKPGVIIPLKGYQESSIYKPGFDGQLIGRYAFTDQSGLVIDGRLLYDHLPTQADDISLDVIALSAGPAYQFKLSDKLAITGGADIGWYVGFGNDDFTTNPVGLGFGDVSFNFTPSFAATLEGSYKYFLTRTPDTIRELAHGVSISLGGSFTPGAKIEPADLNIDGIIFEPVFPVFHKYYDTNQLGSFSLLNNENRAVKDVKVTFYVEQYMDAPKECLMVAELPAGEAVDIPLYALFNMDIMELTEASASTAVINVSYTWHDEVMSREASRTLNIQNRNAMIWDDDRKAASFVTAGDQYVLQFAKNTAGIVRDASNVPINLNLRVAMGIFESLKEYGINYVVDPVSSYVELSNSTASTDYLQFPRQTLSYKAGDCDDLSILYSSMLKAVGMKTAFVTTPGHIFMAFSLGVDEENLKSNFNNSDNFIIQNNEAWIPVEVTQVQSDFLTAWQTGVKLWREYSAKGEARFYPIDEAQKLYQPVGLNYENLSLRYPEDQAILSAYEIMLERFIYSEIKDRVEQLQGRIEQANDKSRERNRLGILYAKYGLYGEAREQLELSLEDKETVSAYVNLGNISYLEGAYEESMNLFIKASELNPENTSVLVGLARSNYEVGNHMVVDRLYDKLIMKSPAAAEKYSYLVMDGGGETRAGIHGRDIEMLWSEEAE